MYREKSEVEREMVFLSAKLKDVERNHFSFNLIFCEDLIFFLLQKYPQIKSNSFSINIRFIFAYFSHSLKDFFPGPFAKMQNLEHTSGNCI